MVQSKVRTPRLGKGLSSLMAQPVAVSPVQPAHPQQASQPQPLDSTGRSESAQASGSGGETLMYLDIARIEPNRHQPRQRFEPRALSRLAQSIKQDGLMQPVVVRPVQNDPGRYELVAGERRWRAAQQAGLTTIPALVRTLEDRQMAEFSLIENLQREDLNPIERAQAFRKLSEQFGLSHDQVAQRVGVERPTVSNSLRLLELSKDVQDLIREGILSAGQARALAAISDPLAQLTLAKRAVTQDWSVRQVEAAVRAGRASQEVAAPAHPTTARAAHLADLGQQIGRQLGTRVRIRQGRQKGAGCLSIDFYSMQQFENLLARLGVKTE